MTREEAANRPFAQYVDGSKGRITEVSGAGFTFRPAVGEPSSHEWGEARLFRVLPKRAERRDVSPASGLALSGAIAIREQELAERWTPQQAREEGFAHAVNRTQGILALPRPLAVEGEKIPYLKGVVQALRNSLESAERALAEAEAAQDRAVSIREEYAGEPIDAAEGACCPHANSVTTPDGHGAYCASCGETLA